MLNLLSSTMFFVLEMLSRLTYVVVESKSTSVDLFDTRSNTLRFLHLHTHNAAVFSEINECHCDIRCFTELSRTERTIIDPNSCEICFLSDFFFLTMP